MDVREKQPSEKRLIDANALKSYMDECSKEARFRVYYGYAKSFIDDAPTVDAVEVVRCKDCKYMIQWADVRYCTVWDGVNGMGDDGFCNYGERKGGGSND